MTVYYTHLTNAKAVRLIKNGNYITMMASWKGVPNVKTYDVIAVRFDRIIDISSNKLDRSFQYRVPERLEKKIEAGMVAAIPFGNAGRVCNCLLYTSRCV